MTHLTVANEQLTFRRFTDGEDRWSDLQEAIFQAGWSHKCPTYVHRAPPCQASCPSGHDIRGWLDIVRGVDKPPAGMSVQEYAFHKMTMSNPFPAVMGRVCPAPCEDGCNRNEVEDHVGINSIEHYIGNWALENKVGFPKPAQETGKKIAVIGGGPAGLSAAYQLRKMGHAVTIYDEHAELGGMMRYGIPGYRTPRDVLDGEIKRIIDMGVDAKMKCRVGKDVQLADLEKNNDAIFWAIGTHSGRGLPVPGADAPNCISGVAFLRAFNQGRLKFVTGRIIVVGGGDTSIDVASVARRLGHITQVHEKDRVEHVVLGQTAHDVASAAKREGADVTLTSLFPVEKMFAAEREVEDAKREGVDIQGGIMPLEVLKGPDGRARALKMCKCTMDGMTPIPQAGTEFEIECDLIVSAIGQKGDMEGLEAMDNGKGFINADKHFKVPGKDKHFVGGDIVRPHLLTTAIGHGWIASESINTFLKGEEFGKRPKVDVHHFNLIDVLRNMGREPEKFVTTEGERGTSSANFAIHNYEDRSTKEVVPADELFLGHFSYTKRNKREEVHISADQVIGNFDERLKTLTDAQAAAEAKRCMSCGLCFECDNCLVFCPQTAVSRSPKAERGLGRYVETDYAKCIGCHICTDVCPTGYIQMGLGE
ncbi:MAG: NAD(P)-binding protein [Rhodospirillales bacterium]|jgi:NADPH-dependent glutamate synthase beta subunit-like oxidoreductase